MASGVDESGHRAVLGERFAERSRSAFGDFFGGLQTRGLSGVRLLISDDHAAMKAAREVRFPGVPWQRCQFHLQQNAGHYVPRLEMRREVADSFTVFTFPSTHRRRLRTSNLMERISKELKRRTRVATLFPNEVSLLRLASAVLMEISEEMGNRKDLFGND